MGEFGVKLQRHERPLHHPAAGRRGDHDPNTKFDIVIHARPNLRIKSTICVRLGINRPHSEAEENTAPTSLAPSSPQFGNWAYMHGNFPDKATHWPIGVFINGKSDGAVLGKGF